MRALFAGPARTLTHPVETTRTVTTRAARGIADEYPRDQDAERANSREPAAVCP